MFVGQNPENPELNILGGKVLSLDFDLPVIF